MIDLNAQSYGGGVVDFARLNAFYNRRFATKKSSGPARQKRDQWTDEQRAEEVARLQNELFSLALVRGLSTENLGTWL